MDGLEEQRDLSLQEKNFRAALKTHQLSLLEAKRIYWKNRAKVKWAKLGGENTNFFHTVATQNYRGNFIASLKDEDDRVIEDHEAKAAVLWHSYKNRVGQSDTPEMLFNLDELITPNTEADFGSLEVPFSTKEIDAIVMNMPADKSPGPDGFNGFFLKRCWNTMKNLFYKLCNQFHEGEMNLESINTVFITLIPKKQNPVYVNDFRPISLDSLHRNFSQNYWQTGYRK